ncbi:tryptophan--tRNA ligase [Blattabacterium cuenoti]|uniref:tryptophan--tRNA ligase n=1 Tax=Blattabacterium cuenoti TaxID=1653831 RepID=UPI00163BB25B|nr:tryptophan--tRNA ligase [Blattabacterium cuenoti]
MKKRILTGIQSTGIPHLGNILGVIIPSIKLFQKYVNTKQFVFIADLHSLIQENDLKKIQNNTYYIAAAWLSFGLNIEKTLLYRQSDVSSEVTELAWYINCCYPYNRLILSHSFKERNKQHDQTKINVGLLTYPILMAADILLYNAEIIPVGKDQLQHIEITRNAAHKLNKKIGKKLFLLPIPYFHKTTMLIPGINGYKMSKSKNNYINIFSSDDNLKKQIMSIKTDNKLFKDKKNPDQSIIISLYKLIADKNQVEKMKTKYLEGQYGYLEAKLTLYKCLIETFSLERKKFASFINNKALLDNILYSGAKQAKVIANQRLNKIRKHFRFKKIFNI